MHNYIWCPYYLPSFMKFCSVVSELRWQTVWRTDRTKPICLPTKVGGGRHNKGNNSETTNVRYFQIKVVISNPTHGEVNLIQHYVIKVCQWLAVGRWLSLGTPVSSTYKTDDITEILLKVVLNTITLTLTVSRDNNIRRLYHINICQILTSAILIFFFWK